MKKKVRGSAKPNKYNTSSMRIVLDDGNVERKSRKEYLRMRKPELVRLLRQTQGHYDHERHTNVLLKLEVNYLKRRMNLVGIRVPDFKPDQVEL